MASKTELAKAYVEIIPSATGIGGKISEALGGEVTAAGATAGQSLGKSLIGAVGKILAAAGIGKMLQAAFTEGSRGRQGWHNRRYLQGLYRGFERPDH